MKRNILILLSCVLLCSVTSASAARKRGSSAVALGVRQHSDHPPEDELPFGESDLSYLLAYEYHEGPSFWQIGLAYTPHASGTSTVDSVITPQVHLLYRDKSLWGGVGIMRSYVRTDDPFWTDFYWQCQMGLHLPLSSAFDLHMGGYYIFKDWGDFTDFGLDDLELGLSVSYVF
jgi:hypothetical protein